MAQNPELGDILARLSQYSHPIPQEGFHAGSESQPSAYQHDSSSSSGAAAQRPPEPQTPARPLVDPATITTWQEGIRCVTKIAAENKELGSRIRKMMRDQRAMEMKWYVERQKLKRVQAARKDSSAQALSILKALNPQGQQDDDRTTSTVGGESELADFHERIYRAQLTLHDNMSLEMKSLGIPFFGTPPSLIIEEDSSLPSKINRPVYSQPITVRELGDLQKRMVTHLEDLYRD